MTYEERTRVWSAKAISWTRYERTIRVMMISFFDNQREDVLRRVPEYMGSKSAKAEGGVLFDLPYWKRRLANMSNPIIQGTMINGAEETLQGTGIAFDTLHPEFRAALGSRVQKFSTFINETTDNEIKKRIRRALQDTAHLNLAEQTVAVRKVLDRYFKDQAMQTRSQLIARTEAFGAANHGTQLGLEQGGFQRKMWLTSRDTKVRDSHLIDGQVVGVNEEFILGDGNMMAYPMDYNERCVMIATFEQKTSQEQILDNDGKERIKKDLREGAIKSRKDLSHGINTVELTSNGIKGVFKSKSGEYNEMVRGGIRPGTQYIREVCAYDVDEAFRFDLVPKTVFREIEGEIGSHQQFIENAEMGGQLQFGGWKELSPAVKEKFSFLDYIIGNEDRHGGNYLLEQISGTEYKLYAIDNGLSFGSPMYEFRNPFYLDMLQSKSVSSIEGIKDTLSEITYSKVSKLVVKLQQNGLGDDSIIDMLARINYIAKDKAKFPLLGNRRQAELVTAEFKSLTLKQALSKLKKVLPE